MKQYSLSLNIIIILSTFFVQGQNCIDIPNMPISQINDNINDDVSYPVGSVYWSSGNIEFVKNQNSGEIFLGNGDTTFCTSSGSGFHMSVANASNPKTLTLQTEYESGIVVDGDTVYQNASPPASYTGTNFSYTSSGMPTTATISGSFDSLEILFSGNLCVYNLCLEEDSVAAVTEISTTYRKDILVFPNPVSQNQELSIKSNETIDKILITDMSGKTIYMNSLSSNETKLIVDEKFDSGIYFISVLSGQRKEQKKIVVY